VCYIKDVKLALNEYKQTIELNRLMKRSVILCVDDEKTLLVGLRDQLRNHLGKEYAIEIAESGEEALEVVQEFLEEQFDIPVIISDHCMPRMKGDELLIRIHELAPETLMILLTGQADVTVIGNIVNHASLYRYIPKPWQTTDLVLTVKQAIKSYFQERQLTEQHHMLQMANEKLGDLNQQLEEYAYTLEQKVSERTLKLEEANQELYRLANLDGLTLVANRRQFDSYLMQEWKRYTREKLPLALLFCDLDYFKHYRRL